MMCKWIAEGSTADVIRFKTVHCGWLTVGHIEQHGKQLLQMSLPLNAPHDPLLSGTELGSPLYKVSILASFKIRMQVGQLLWGTL